MSSPTHDFDNFSCRMSSPGKNLIIYDVLTTNIHGILAKNFKKISQNLKKLKVYLQLMIYYHIFAHCARLILGLTPGIFFHEFACMALTLCNSVAIRVEIKLYS